MSDVVRLEYRNVTMRFAAASAKSLTAVQGVSFSVRDGEVVSLIGPSGCGKSTLLNIGSGLYTPSEGEAFVGGKRQRVALARTLAVDPSVLLLDEPFSAVDAQTRMVLQRELAQTLKRAGKTALLITHELLEAVTLSDRVLVMSRRPGRIIDEIRVELPQRDDPIARRHAPRVNEYVARLMDRLDIGHAGQDAVGASA